MRALAVEALQVRCVHLSTDPRLPVSLAFCGPPLANQSAQRDNESSAESEITGHALIKYHQAGELKRSPVVWSRHGDQSCPLSALTRGIPSGDKFSMCC